MMRIIPVIDLRLGQVVHAVAGQRDRYSPVRSHLCPGSDPCTIVQSFLGLYPFETVYIADLDAISGNRTNHDCIEMLLDNFPHLDFWLDQGLRDKTAILNATHKRIVHVVGSETNISPEQLSRLQDVSRQPVLSLDFKDGKFLGDKTLLQHPEVWPDNIILMNLGRVGTGSGVDGHLLMKILKSTERHHAFIGGGIRDISDIRHLQDMGIAGVLVATALHTGKISTADLMAMGNVETKKMPR